MRIFTHFRTWAIGEIKDGKQEKEFILLSFLLVVNIKLGFLVYCVKFHSCPFYQSKTRVESGKMRTKGKEENM